MNNFGRVQDIELIGQKPVGQLTPKDIEIANYITDMLLELRKMAKAANMSTLLVLLEVSFYEAFSLANRIEIPADEIARLHELERIGRQSNGL